jgi:NAD(P)H-dependent FMN reductase
MPKLQVIVGSTRPTRAADRVVPWVVASAERRGGFEVEVLDLRDWALPFFQEHFGTIGDIADPTYSDPIVRSWNRKLAQGDAYLIVTAEYNHSVPGQLKNALDSVFVSWALRNKPVACVGYSGGIAAGTRAVEHLALIVIEAEAVPLRNNVLIPFVADAFDEAGEPTSPDTKIALGITLDDLAWFAGALGRARADGELPPREHPPPRGGVRGRGSGSDGVAAVAEGRGRGGAHLHPTLGDRLDVGPMWAHRTARTLRCT